MNEFDKQKIIYRKSYEQLVKEGYAEIPNEEVIETYLNLLDREVAINKLMKEMDEKYHVRDYLIHEHEKRIWGE